MKQKILKTILKEVTGESDVSNLERNSDGTFKIDYKVSMEPQDTGEVTTRFNNVTSKIYSWSI